MHTRLVTTLTDNIDKLSEEERESFKKTITIAGELSEHLREDLDLHTKNHGCYPDNI